ncbi:MAG: hypothetical protein INR68_18560 [Methylobacterium mesophilicum]|nr:hypothetical protein [Methylobacterium mesophilicum]
MDEQASHQLEQRVRTLVRSCSARFEPGDPDHRFDDLAMAGVTSVELVGLMLAIEQEFDVAIPSREINAQNFKGVSSISALIRRLSGMAPCT